jgi:4-hydroxy-4-methyl-2-oxoglutarate aldolase
MKVIKALTVVLFSAYAEFAMAQTADAEALRRGVNFIETKTHSESEDAAVLKLFQGLRVADVSDGMDRAGLPGTGLVDPSILPLWKDLEGFSHRICGIALTVRYVPAQIPALPENMDGFAAWEGSWYNGLSSETWTQLIRPGAVVVIDDAEDLDVGTIGSFNILAWYKAGAVGVVTDAGARDTDEISREKVPLYLKRKSRGIRPGRNVLESVNRPMDIGGVLVRPGDVVVADGDGVVVVPRVAAKDVAMHARGILDGDKAGRKALYKSMGLPLDWTVE